MHDPDTNPLNVLYVVFMSFLVMRVIFVMSEPEISRFLTIWE